MLAKAELKNVSGVTFVLNNTIEGTMLMTQHGLSHAPAFCFDDGFFTYSLLEAKKRLTL